MASRERFSDMGEALMVRLRKQRVAHNTLVTVEAYLIRIMSEQHGDAFREALGDATAAAYQNGYAAGRYDLAGRVDATPAASQTEAPRSD
jgi:hypothetical protein